MSDVARASADAADALRLFADLVPGSAEGQDSVGFMAFDAHVGDTGCQLRAGMMQDVFLLYRQIFRLAPDTWEPINEWIEDTAAKLRAVHFNAKNACMKLVRDKVHPNKLGLGTTEDIPENMLRVLGWDLSSVVHLVADVAPGIGATKADSGANKDPSLLGPFAILQASSDDGSSYSSTVSSLSNSTRATSTTSTELDLDLSRTETPSGFVKEAQGESSDPCQNRLETNAALSSSAMRTQEFVERTLPIITQWDPLNLHTLARFVVFSYVLSKYKRFSILNGTVGARLAPEAAADTSHTFVSPYQNSKKKPGKPQRILREFVELQSWLSRSSCAWQRSLARRSSQGKDMEG